MATSPAGVRQPVRWESCLPRPCLLYTLPVPLPCLSRALSPAPLPPPFLSKPRSLTTHLAAVGGVQPEKHLHGGYHLYLQLQPQARLYQDEEGRGSEYGDVACGGGPGQRSEAVQKSGLDVLTSGQQWLSPRVPRTVREAGWAQTGIWGPQPRHGDLRARQQLTCLLGS